jgi:hypothetical protein
VAPLVEALLCDLDSLARECLHGVGATGNECCGVLFCAERREHVVGDGARVTATRPADADSQP